MTNSPVLFETNKWSELSDVINQYLGLVKSRGDQEVRMFGYASLIKDHNKEKAGSALDNESARVNGMEVDMNVFAIGNSEFRGTNDRENGVMNAGLYAGLGPSLEADGYAEGINVTVDMDNAIDGLKAYVKREVGDFPPAVVDLLPEDTTHDHLFDPKESHRFDVLKNTEHDRFTMYTFQIIETHVGEEIVPAITVSTDPTTELAAVGLTPGDAAMYIIDGIGSRGSALEYFENNLKAQRELGVESPRLEAINDSVQELLELYRDLDEMPESKWADRIQEYAADKPNVVGTETVDGVEGVPLSVGPLSYRVFESHVQNAERAGLDQGYKEALPKTGEEKISHAADILRNREAADAVRTCG